nr:hypothetical protein YKEOBPQY_YKEOBPQY_CDS_0001 [Microvirus sp.]
MPVESAKKKPEFRIDPFGVVLPVDRSDFGVDLSDPYVDVLGLELDKETGNTKVVVTGKRNTVEEIQSFKDDCGLVAAMRDISSGLLDPASLADDGKHGGDFSNPTMLAEMSSRLRQTRSASSEADEASRKAGLDVEALHGDKVEEYLNNLIKSQLEKFAKPDGGNEK